MSTKHSTLTGNDLHFSKIKTASGSPNLNSFATVTGSQVGDVYLDMDTQTLYVREGLTGADDWVAAPIQHIGQHPIIFTTSGAVSVTLPLTGTLLSTTSTIPYSMLSLLGQITNNDIHPTANIQLSKLEPLTASKVVISNASGVITTSTLGASQLDYLGTVTSNIQTQLDSKAASGSYLTGISGDVVANGPGNATATIQVGVVTNAMLAGLIAYSKLVLTNSITNADLAGSIAYAKLVLSNSIVNADISASAAIADSKLATISTAGKVANSATTASSSSGADTIVLRDGTGSFSANNVTVGGTLTTSGALSGTAITTSGAANLGNSSSIAHTFQGSQTSAAQVNIINNATGADVAGLKISLPNDTTSTAFIQEWSSGGTRRGSVDGAGKFIIGAVGGTQIHTINGSASATVALTTPVINVSSYGEITAFGTPATPAANKIRFYSKADKKMYYINDTGLEVEIGGSGASAITALTGDVTATGPGSAVATIANSAINNAKVSATAAIAYSKLNLFGGVINDDISASAGITLSKLAAMTASRVAVSDGSGFLTPSAITTTQLNRVSFLDGVSSDVQTQLNAKQASGNYVTGLTGHVVATGPGSVASTIQANVITNAMIVASAGIPYSKLDLTGSIVGNDITNGTISDAKLATISTAGKVSNSATTATHLNTASAIVARDASGNFTANTATLTATTVTNATITTGTIGTLTATNATTDTLGITNYEEFTNLSVIPGTPAAGKVRVYTKTDKKIYMKNDAGTESEVGASTAITALTGDVTATGPGSVAATIGALKVTNAMLAGSIADSKLSTITTIGKVSNSATTATTNTTGTTIVLRDSGGNIAATGGTFTGTVEAPTLAVTTYEDFSEVTAPATPAAGKVRVYAKTDKKVYRKGSDGVETELGGGGTAITSLTGHVTGTGPGATATTIAAGVVTNAMLAGSIAYSKLVLSGAILNADLAGSISDSKLSTITTAGKVDNSATTATATNVASAIVARDASGNISVGNITGKFVTLGDTAVSSLHTLQGAQAGDYQVKITNNSGTGNGLSVKLDNGGAGLTIQDWIGGTTSKGSVKGNGAWIFGPATGFAGSLSHLFNGGISILGNIVGTEPAANKTMLDNNLGAARLFACGPDTSTNGTFLFQSLRSNGLNGINTASTDVTGAWSFAVSTSAPIVSVTNYGDFTEVASPATPSSGKLRLFAKTDKKFYTKDSTGLEKVVGSGGDLNYISNPDAEAGTTGWITGGAATLVASTTNKIRGVQSFLVTGSAVNNEAYTILANPTTGTGAIDSRDTSSTLKIKFDFNNLGAAGDWQVHLYDYTAVAYITPSVSLIPGGKGTFEAVVATSANTSYALTLRRVAGTSGLHFDSVFVGPQEVFIAPVVTDWVSYSPTITGLGTGAYATAAANSFMWKRDGDTLHIRVRFLVTTAGSGTSDVTIPLPTGMAIDSTKISATGNNDFGRATVLFGAGSSASYHAIDNGTTGVRFYDQEGTWGGLTGAALTSSTVFWAKLELPISSWTSNLQVANNNVEFAWNAAVGAAGPLDDTTTFGNGPQGSPIFAYAPAGNNAITKRVRFQTPIQNTDVITLEIFLPSRGWMSVADSSCAYQQNDAGTVGYGMRWFRTTSGSTDCDVFFHSVVDKNGTTWSAFSTGFWRLRKSSGVNANVIVGDKIGVSDNSLAAAGYVGEIKEVNSLGSISTNAVGSSAFVSICSITLTSGDWDVSGTGVLSRGTMTGGTELALGISASSTTADSAQNGLSLMPMAASGNNPYQIVGVRRMRVAAGTTQIVHLVGRVTYTGGTPTFTAESYLSARRMR